FPLGWIVHREHDSPPLARGASAYVGIGRRYALRLNVAEYEVDPWVTMLGDLRDIGGGECTGGGRAKGIGIGAMSFGRERWPGWSVEPGLVGRALDTYQCLEESPPHDLVTHTPGVAARGLVGWNWPLFGQLYASVAAGASLGREWGTETRDQVMTTRVHRF